jgi:hypothetical protein
VLLSHGQQGHHPEDPAMKRHVFLLGALAALACLSATAQTTTTSVPLTPLQVTVTPTTVTITGGAAPVTIPVPQVTPTCPALPAPTTATIACPAGETGSWKQTTTYSSAPYPTCAVATLSPTAPPAGACTTTPSNVSWVYHAGKFLWLGDMNWNATSNYSDTAGGPTAGPYDIATTVNNGGGWQPAITGTNYPGCQQNVAMCFNTAGYNYLLLQLKPTKANQVWAVGFESSGDTVDGPQLLDISPYCSGGTNPAVGVWDVCKIPLTVFALTNPVILKFSVQDRTNAASNVFYAQEVGFSAT